MFECYADSVNVLNSFFDIVGSADKFYWLLQKVISSLKLHTQYSRIGHPQSEILAISSYSMHDNITTTLPTTAMLKREIQTRSRVCDTTNLPLSS